MNAQIVRPARRWPPAILTISFALSLMPVAAQAKVGSRSVLYTYFRAECFTWIRVAESPSGPKAEVTLEPLYAQDRRKSFRISQAEFDEIWATLNAPGVVKRVVHGGDKGLSDVYLFSDGEQHFAVSVYSDSPAVSRLALRMRGYGDGARDGMMELIPYTEVVGTELVDFGIYESKPGGRVELVKRTDVIPGRVNTNFGIRYRLTGKPKGRETSISVEIEHPKAVNPKTGAATTVEKADARIGIESLDYRGVKLSGWYAVPGRWVIKIWHGGNVVLKKTFEVTASN